MKLSDPKYYVAVFILLVIVVVGYFVVVDKDKVVEEKPLIQHPVQNEEEYIQKYNEAINESERVKEQYKKYLNTEGGKKKSQSYWDRMKLIAQSAINDLTFYGLVVDQNGNPVPGATVEYYAFSDYLSEGSGYNRATTDKKGIFEITGVKGSGLSIDKVTRSGYEIRVSQRNFESYNRFGDSVLWSDHSDISKPFIFTGWKVSEQGYPRTSKAKGNYGFKPGKIYSLDFTKSNASRVGRTGMFPLDLQVLFNKDESSYWELILTVPDGGLLETDEEYMNLAPASGYVSSVSFQGNEKHIDIYKNYYIHSRGKLYGRLKLTVKPHTNVGSGLIIDHVMNLDGGRNLEVK